MAVVQVCPSLESTPALLAKYHEDTDIFEKNADVLPSHQEYDCWTELQPESSISFSYIYVMPEPDQVTLCSYLWKNLAISISFQGACSFCQKEIWNPAFMHRLLGPQSNSHQKLVPPHFHPGVVGPSVVSPGIH